MCLMRKDLAALGNKISDDNFTAVLIGSIPKSYDTYLSAITATMSVLNRKLEPDVFMLSVLNLIAALLEPAS